MSDTIEHLAAKTSGRTWRASKLALLAGGLDLAIVHLWLTDRIDTQTALLEHFAIAALLCVLATLWQRRISPETAVLGGAMLLLGPLGGIALLIVELGSLPQRFGPQHTEHPTGGATHSAQTVMAQIQQNRRPVLRAARPPSFARVLRCGSLAQQQDAIAAILRHYDPELLPLLRQALASPVPAIRVQAAAVYAKLRSTFEARAKAVLADDALKDISDIEAFIAETEAVALSGFVDAETQAMLRAVGARADGDRTRTSQTYARKIRDGRAGAASEQVSTQPPRIKRYTCGGIA